jgi:hypothetical protein
MRLETSVASLQSLRSPAALEAVNYVRIWEDAGQDGASMYLSQDYANLGSIYWNDRITSFKALNGESGVFHHDVGYETPYSFCCNQSVNKVGSTHNDKFSSVERT